ncbi:MAG: serine/threonine protein kinase [Verrucomicrobia bacterium]|nr:serine/threonine protein kinase [Verrucomicrobiota bacterium]
MIAMKLLRSLLAAAVLSSALHVQSENWPQFRGPRGDGTSLEKGVPTRWSATENVRWKTSLPGQGHSAPIVWDNSVFLTTAVKESERRLLLRLAADSGKILWQRTVVTAASESMHGENSGASSTPATDGAYVFTSFQAGDRVDLRCFDFDGNLVWSTQPLRFDGEHGYSYSPIVHQNLLLFDCRQEGEAALLALDKKTGKVLWRAKPGRARISHVTPLVIQNDGRDQVVVCGSDEIRSYNPSTGDELWRCDGPSDVAVAGLSFGNGMVFATAGYPTKTRLAVRASGRGNVTKSHVAWSLRRQVTYVPSPVFHDGYLYTVLDDGMLLCFDTKNGEPAWEHRLGGRFRASLLLANGHVYAVNDQGLTTVFEATPKAFRPVASNQLKEFCYATAAIAGGSIFIRTAGHLYCIGTGHGSSTSEPGGVP